MEIKRLTFNECIQAMDGLKPPKTKEGQIVVNQKREWLTYFIPLLKYYVDRQKDELITSEELAGLWMFFLEGIRIKNVFKDLNDETYNYLIGLTNPLQALYDDPIETIVKKGVFLYQVSHHIDVIKTRLGSAKKKYDLVYSISDDPIDWFKNNNYKYSFDIDEILQKKISQNFDKILHVENSNYDPVFRQ